MSENLVSITFFFTNYIEIVFLENVIFFMFYTNFITIFSNFSPVVYLKCCLLIFKDLFFSKNVYNVIN